MTQRQQRNQKTKRKNETHRKNTSRPQSPSHQSPTPLDRRKNLDARAGQLHLAQRHIWRVRSNVPQGHCGRLSHKHRRNPLNKTGTGSIPVPDLTNQTTTTTKETNKWNYSNLPNTTKTLLTQNWWRHYKPLLTLTAIKIRCWSTSARMHWSLLESFQKNLVDNPPNQ